MKREIIILAIIIILLGVYLAIKNKGTTHYSLPELPEIKAEDIDRVTIKKGERLITLKKNDDQWQIMPQGYPADGSRVERIIDVIKGLKLVTLVSEAKDYRRYDLAGDNKITVTAYKGDKVLRGFDIGKPAPTYRHTFVKLRDDHRVYHADGSFRSSFDLTIDNLRDKRVLSFDQDRIEEVVFKKGKETLTIVKTEVTEKKDDKEEKKTVWRQKDGKGIDEARFKEILRTLSHLRCQGYMDEKASEGLDRPLLTVTIKGERTYTLDIFSKEGNRYPARSSENKYPFYLSSWLAEKIMEFEKL